MCAVEICTVDVDVDVCSCGLGCRWLPARVNPARTSMWHMIDDA